MTPTPDVTVIPILPATGMALDDEAPPVPLDIVAFLQLAASGGVGWLIGGVLAYMFEEIAWFQTLSSQTKRWVSIILSVSVPLLAMLLLQIVPGNTWYQLNPYFGVLVTVLAGLFGNKREYRSVIKPQQRQRYWKIVGESNHVD